MKFVRSVFIYLLLLSPSVSFADKYIVTVNQNSNLFLSVDLFNSPASLSHIFVAPIQADKVLPSIDSFVADLTSDQLHFLRMSPNVLGVFKDEVRYLLEQVSADIEIPDFRFSKGSVMLDQSAEEYTYGLVNIKIPDVRAKYPDITGRGVVVGVIDSGIDPAHPALQDKVISFKDFTDQKKPDPYDDNGHGTHVAGTIAGSIDKPKFGVAPSVKMVVAKVFSASGSANDSTILSAMEWMSEQGVSVVSNSWGGQQDTTSLDNPYARMIAIWIEKRMVPVFAAGNSGPSSETMSIPGGLPDAYAVGAVGESDQLAYFSSRGPITWDGVSYNKPDIVPPE